MIKFGTSGFRGIIGDNWTKENLQKIGVAFRKICEEKKKPIQVIVGFDNRFMGRECAQWFCEVVACEKVKITLTTESVPSPYITFKTNSKVFDFGIMITSSHNPYIYNGIKVFLPGGKDADDKFCAKMESMIESLGKESKVIPFQELVDAGMVAFSDNTDDYVDKVVSMLDIKKIKQSNLRVLFNPMHGSSAKIAKKLFEKIGISFAAINDNIDPYFGGTMPSAYPRHLGGMAEQIVNDGFNFGFALDGDGDRFTFIDGDGKIYDCNFILAALYYYLVEIKKQKGDVAKIFVSSSLTTKLCEHYGFNAFETRVGSKFIAEQIETKDSIIIGGEGNGVLFKQMSLARDGITAAAMITELIATTGKSIGAILAEIVKKTNYPSHYTEFAYPFDASVRGQLLSKIMSPVNPPFALDIVRRDNYPDGFKIVFNGGYFCAARTSGTENLVRFYTEMQTESACNEILETMEKFYSLKVRQK